jgi:hypothetical protein
LWQNNIRKASDVKEIKNGLPAMQGLGSPVVSLIETSLNL